MTSHADLIRAYLGAYDQHDRAQLEAVLADDFRFDSPRAEGLDRASYFTLCWPVHAQQRSVTIERIVDDGDTSAYVTYRIIAHDARRLHNTDHVRFASGKIIAIEGFFGQDRGADGQLRK